MVKGAVAMLKVVANHLCVSMVGTVQSSFFTPKGILSILDTVSIYKEYER
mgnify:CR=1 FL=1